MDKISNNITDRQPSSTLSVIGARVHNLKNIDVDIPLGKLTVLTGLSGSGKSSLAFDTIYAEGQRRYIDTFSSYARGFLGNLERPDVDHITGLSPVIAIEQKTVNRNPRSTIGTTTEIYDFLRLLFARIGEARSYVTGEPMVKYTIESIVELILNNFEGRKIYVLAPLIKNRKGHYKELFEQLRKKGYINVRIDGVLHEITPGLRVDRYKNHSIELVIDRLKVGAKDKARLRETVENALRQGDRQLMIYDMEADTVSHYSQMLMDPVSGISYREPAPHNFSFNSPQGACHECKGLGYVNIIDRDKIMPDMNKSIFDGGILPLGKYRNSMIFWQVDAICRKYGATGRTPLAELPDQALSDILNGTPERIVVNNETLASSSYLHTYEGILKYIEMQQQQEADEGARKWSERFFSRAECPECKGQRLNREALHFFVDGNNIAQLCNLDIEALYQWSCTLEERLSPSHRLIAAEILKEIRSRLKFLVDVGLGYLSLSRNSASLSGGESQRIRLATQLGSQLVGVLYILDEPSIGLHQRDNLRLINSLKQLRDASNTVIVVEHDKEIMQQADYVVDIGPGAGRHGGEVVYQGDPSAMPTANTLTADYLAGRRALPIPAERRKGSGNMLKVLGASGNNLRDVDLAIPLGTLTVVSGVSGSGKSSLINATLQPILSQHLYRSLTPPLPYRAVEGLEHIDKVVTVDQSPLGRSPRSCPATYTGVMTAIRTLFSSLPEARLRGYKPGRFSFNVAGGRCPECAGCGYRTIEMNFLPDVMVPCAACGGRRYNRETLEVRLRGHSIASVLDMTIAQACDLFADYPALSHPLQVMREVGLGYVKLGQPSSTLSGGECQRLKLAAELARRDSGRTLYVLDEPTTGLHFDDVRALLEVLNKLVDRGNTVVVIEHNLDIIKNADYVIDMGPAGGAEGGRIVAQGTPEEVAQTQSPTAPFIAQEL